MFLQFLLNSVEQDKYFPLSVSDEGRGRCTVTVPYSLAVAHGDDVEIRAGPIDSDALVGHWRFDEGAGSDAIDSSRNGNNGVINGASWVDGKYGKALSFDGSNDYVQVADSTSLRLTSVGSILLWFKSGGTQLEAFAGFLEKGVGGAAADISYVLYRPGGEFIQFLISDGANFNLIGKAFDYTDANWHFVAARWDGSFLRLSIDLVEQTPVAQTLNAQSAAHYLRVGEFTSNNFLGIIDEVRVYNRALTPAEIGILYGVGNSCLLSSGTILEGEVFEIDAERKRGIKTLVCRGKTDTLYQEYVLNVAHDDYASKDAGWIVNDLVDFYFSGILTSVNVDTATGVTISSIDGYGKTVGDMIDEINDRAGTICYVDKDDDVHFFVEGDENSGLRFDAGDVFDVKQTTQGEAVAKVTVAGGCAVTGSAGAGIPHKYVTDRRVADNTEATEVATALLALYNTARVSTDIQTCGFWDLHSGQSVIVNLPDDGFTESTEIVRRVRWDFGEGSVQTIVTVGDEDPDLSTSLSKIIRDLEAKRDDFGLTTSAHDHNHDSTNTNAHAGTNTDAHGGTNTNAHAGGAVIAPTAHAHSMAEVPASGYSGTAVYWDVDDSRLFYDAGGGSTPSILASAENAHTHAFTQPNNHSITQPNNHSITQPNNHSVTQPAAHANHTVC